MYLKQIAYIIYKNIKFIIIIPIAAALITYFASIKNLEPSYRSYATLYVVNKADGENTINYNDLLSNQQLVKDYREIIKSRNVTRSVIDELGIKDMSPEELANKISVRIKPDTRVLQINVDDKDPYRAKDLANKTSEKFIDKSIEIKSADYINIVDRAELPIKPTKTKPIAYSLSALLFGLVLITGLVYLIELRKINNHKM